MIDPELRELLGKRWSVHVLGGALVAGCILVLIVIVWRTQQDSEFIAAGERRVGALEVGMTKGALMRRAGRPDTICANRSSVESLADRMDFRGARTREIWIYRVRPSNDESTEPCRPRYLDTVLGIDSEQLVLWYVRNFGESRVETK